MNSQRSLSGIIVFFLFFLIPPGYVFAENKSDVFLQRGITFYHHQDFDQAIDQLTRALLVNPHNQRAFENLMMMAADGEGLTAEQKIKLFLLEDLSRYIQNLNQKIKYLEYKRDILKKDLRQRSIEIEDFSLRPEALNRRPEDMAALNHIPDPLSRLTSFLTFQKEQLLHQWGYLEKEVSQLYELKKEHPQRIRIISPTTELPALVERHRYPHETTENDVALLKQDLALVRTELNDLKDRVEDKDQKIARLTGELVDFALKLTEKEMVLEEKVARLSSLHEEFFDLQSRFELEQKIMRDKNAQVQLLQDNLKGIQSEITDRKQELNRILSSKDEKLIELNGILQIYKGKLGDTVKELKGVRGELSQKDTALQQTKEQFAVLENRLTDLQQEILKLKSQSGAGDNPSDYQSLNKEILDLQAEVRGVIGTHLATREIR